MSVRSLRHALLVAAAVAVLAGAQPALGYTELKVTGTVGAHSLTDTSSSPGVICVYKYNSTYDAWRFKHIWVNPPKMKAVAGQGNEKVGWRFIVQRRGVGLGGASPWSKRYTSPVFTAYTDSTHNASFSQEDVKVVVPTPGVDGAYQYRVLVKLFWYRANGTVLGTAKERVDWYNAYQELDSTPWHYHCWDWL